MRSAALGFALGVCVLQTRSGLPGLAALLALVVGAAICAGLAGRVRAGAGRLACLLAAGVLCGAVWSAALAHGRLMQSLPVSLEGRDLVVVGTVASLPHVVPQGVRFSFSVEQIIDSGASVGATVPRRLALSWQGGFAREGGMAAEVRPGERWRLNIRLKRPHGNANPYGFDYEAWLLEQDIRATGYVRTDRRSGWTNERLDAFIPGVGHAIERARYWLRERIQGALASEPYASVIVALVIGDQRGIAQSDWEVFNRTGIGHLISISGLHITMISGMFAAIAGALWKRSFYTGAQLPLILPAQKAAAAAGVLAAAVYVLLAGAGIPAQRTLWMICTVALALWTGRIAAISHVLCTALLVVLLMDPWAVLWPGFWLSFGAVGVLLYASAGTSASESRAASGTMRWQRTWKTCRSACQAQYVVTLGLVPLTMLLFGQTSLISPVANAVAIPLISLFVAPASLIGAFLPQPLADAVLHAAHFGIEQLSVALHHLARLDNAVWKAPIPSPFAFGAAVAGTLWMLAPAGWPHRWAGAAAWFPLLLAGPTHPPPDSLRVTAFDVGQGMALLVETAGHRLLYDTGPAYSPESDGALRVIVPYLKARGITRLDAMIVSHGDIDHSGGAASVVKAVPVGWTASSLHAGAPLAEMLPDHRRCVAGQRWSWDGVAFEMLHPEPELYGQPGLKPNARSCVLKVTVRGRSILLAGDIEAAQEARLVDTSAGKLRADVLLAPHHGSGTSSTLAFLHAVRPDIALFQVGYRNRFRHPKDEVVERYGDLGVRRLRTDESGAITLEFGDRIDVSEHRRTHARYWHGK